MTLRLTGHIDLPAHVSTGGFDHAAIHARTDRLYVAHTANDAVDVIDCSRRKYVSSIANLTAVAGVLISEEAGLAFTSNLGGEHRRDLHAGRGRLSGQGDGWRPTQRTGLR